MASSFVGSSTSTSTEMIVGIFTDHIGSPTQMVFPVEKGTFSCLAEQEQQQREPLNAFTCFSSLPAELRLQVWGLASHEPRKIDLKCERLRSRNSRTWKFESITQQPSVLQVNREARCVGLGFYELGFQRLSRDYGDGHEDGRHPSFYANWKVDTLWPMNLRTWDSEALGLLFQEKSMKTLALNVETISCGWFLGLRLHTLIIYSASKDTLKTILGSPARFQVAGLEPVSIDVDDEAEIQRLRDAARGVEEWGLLTPSEEETLAFLQARIWVKGEFEELERVQRLRREWMDAIPGAQEEEVPREVVRSAAFDDAFSRSGLWLKKEEELPVVRKMPEIGFARVVLG